MNTLPPSPPYTANASREQHKYRVLVCLCGLLLGEAEPTRAAEPPGLSITIDAELLERPVTTPGYLFFSRRQAGPRRGPNWFGPEPFCRLPVREWKAGESYDIDLSRAEWFPKPLSLKQLRGYRMQAVLRTNPWEREVGTGPGNLYGDAVRITDGKPLTLHIDRRVKAPEPIDREGFRELSVSSKRLGEFYDRDVSIRALVRLPKSYGEEPERRYPVVFDIPGFGGTHRSGLRYGWPNPTDVEFLWVTLDPSCPLGHHVFADSENNGPWGTALVEDFLPAFDRAFRSIAEPESRFLTGHSSGGWSSLWVQVRHPNTFGGVWSTAPDPIDFRDFQQVNLYEAGANLYTDAEGQPRPLARMNGRVVVLYRDFARMEEVLGPGGQLHSFEAVFSPRGADGKPLPMWNWTTGKVDPAVAETWKRYDIRLYLERHWDEIGDDLHDKLHIHMGTADTFYLEGAVEKLKPVLEELDRTAVVELHPGRTHFDLLTRTLRERIVREMAESWRANSSSKWTKASAVAE